MKSENFNWMYRIGHTLSGWLFKYIMRSEAYNIEHIPKSGPFLLAVNHSSFFDPFAAGSFFHRDIHFFARKTLFKPGFISWCLHRFNSIPVDRDGADVKSMKQVFAALKKGEGLLVFPEGTRSLDGEIQPAKRGVGMMACKTQVPVVPLRLYGAFESWGRSQKYPDLSSPLTAVYGKALLPAEFDPGKDNPDRYQIAANRILESIKALDFPQEKVY